MLPPSRYFIFYLLLCLRFFVLCGMSVFLFYFHSSFRFLYNFTYIPVSIITACYMFPWFPFRSFYPTSIYLVVRIHCFLFFLQFSLISFHFLRLDFLFSFLLTKYFGTSLLIPGNHLQHLACTPLSLHTRPNPKFLIRTHQTVYHSLVSVACLIRCSYYNFFLMHSHKFSLSTLSVCRCSISLLFLLSAVECSHCLLVSPCWANFSVNLRVWFF